MASYCSGSGDPNIQEESVADDLSIVPLEKDGFGWYLYFRITWCLTFDSWFH